MLNKTVGKKKEDLRKYCIKLFCNKSQKIELTTEFASLEKSYQERNSHDSEKRDEELQFLEFQNKRIMQFLEYVRGQDNVIEVKLALEKNKKGSIE